MSTKCLIEMQAYEDTAFTVVLLHSVSDSSTLVYQSDYVSFSSYDGTSYDALWGVLVCCAHCI